MKVSMKTTLNVSAEEVWRVVSDFNGLPKFLALIAESKMEGEGVGAIRTLKLRDGGPPVIERLENLDDQGRMLSYSIIESPLPVSNYLATIEVKDLGGNQCQVLWASTFEAKGVPEQEAKKVVEGIYLAAFEGLQKLYGP